MNLDNWQGISNVTQYHAGQTVFSMIFTANNKILATIGKDICILTPSSMAKKVLLTLPTDVTSLIPLPNFNIDTYPYVIYLCRDSVGIADLNKREYK